MAELITRRDGAVGRIVFSNPVRMNAMTFDMWRALPEALAAFDADPAVRLVVLAGGSVRAATVEPLLARAGVREVHVRGTDPRVVQELVAAVRHTG